MRLQMELLHYYQQGKIKKAQNLREGSCRGAIDSSTVTTYRQIVIDNNNNLRQQSPSESLIQSVSREKFINVLNLILY